MTFFKAKEILYPQDFTTSLYQQIAIAEVLVAMHKIRPNALHLIDSELDRKYYNVFLIIDQILQAAQDTFVSKYKTLTNNKARTKAIVLAQTIFKTKCEFHQLEAVIKSWMKEMRLAMIAGLNVLTITFDYENVLNELMRNYIGINQKRTEDLLLQLEHQLVVLQKDLELNDDFIAIGSGSVVQTSTTDPADNLINESPDSNYCRVS